MPNLRSKTWTTTTPATVGDAQYWEDHLISDTAAAKAESSVQTVNSVSPDANGNVDVVALPEGGTTGQVLTKLSNTSGDADWLDPASGGHTIQDDNGTSMTQRTILQFENADVTDDAVNGKTVVDCKGAKGDAATVTVGTTSTLPAGSSATVTNSGTTSAAVFNFGIPAGADGTDGDDGVSVTGVELLSTSGKVKTYRMSFSDGNHFDYQVTDGSDGSGAGDMLKADYDSTSAVLNAGGIPSYVSGVLPVITNTYSSTSEDGMSGKAVKQAIDSLDVSDSAVSGQYVSAVSETDGKISVTRANLPTVPTKVSDLTNDSGYQTASDVSTAISGKADTSSLGDLAYIDKDGVSSTKVLQGDGTWVTPSSGGHNMISNSNLISAMNTAITEGVSNDDVVSAYGVGKWSNVDRITLWTTVAKDADCIGAWNDTWETDGIRTGWIYHSLLAGVLSNNNVDMKIEFDPSASEPVSLAGWRIDDSYTYNGNTVGCIAIKLNAPVQNASGIKVAVVLDFKRNEVINVGTIS